MSMALAALKDRVMLRTGRLVRWRSPEGAKLRLAAAAPSVPWTDLSYALVPNGSTLDYVADAPYFMHGRWERDADQAAGLLRQEAEEDGLRPVALHAALKAQGAKAMLTQFAADWFHPNDRGHRVWADAFWDRMAPELALLGVPDGERPAPIGADDDALALDGDVQRRAAGALVDGDGLRRTAGAAGAGPRPS